MNKKREAELSKLRREIEESNVQHDNQLGILRKKHNDAVAEMGDQLDQLQKQKSKSVVEDCIDVVTSSSSSASHHHHHPSLRMDKDRQYQTRTLEDLNSQLDSECKSKGNMEKLVKQLEAQCTEVQVPIFVVIIIIGHQLSPSSSPFIHTSVIPAGARG